MKTISKLKRIRLSMPVISWLLPLLLLLQLLTPLFYELVRINSPEVAYAVGAPSFTQQFEYSLIVIVFLILPLAICYALRFYLIRRRIHTLLAPLIALMLFIIPLGLFATRGDGSPSFVSILSMYAGYKILRIDNIKDILFKQKEPIDNIK